MPEGRGALRIDDVDDDVIGHEFALHDDPGLGAHDVEHAHEGPFGAFEDVNDGAVGVLVPDAGAGEGDPDAVALLVGLHDADRLVELRKRDARADRGIGRQRRGGRGVGIDAEVDVAQRAELGFKNDGFSFLDRAAQKLGRVADIGREGLAVFLEPGHDLVELDGRVAVAALHRQVLPLQNARQALAQGVPVQQVAHADRLLHVLVGVDRRDAAPRRAELLVAQAILLEPVEQLVIGHADRCAVGDLQVLRRDLDARLAQALGLAVEVLKVDDDAGAEDVGGLVAQDAGGHQVHDEFALFVDDRVSGVVAALIADDHVILLAQKVDHAALSLVSPVGSHNRCQHVFCLLIS